MRVIPLHDQGFYQPIAQGEGVGIGQQAHLRADLLDEQREVHRLTLHAQHPGIGPGEQEEPIH